LVHQPVQANYLLLPRSQVVLLPEILGAVPQAQLLRRQKQLEKRLETLLTRLL
jgi:hypothetical protein